MRRLAPFLFGLAFVAPSVAHAERDFYPLYSIDSSTLEHAARANAERLVATCNTSPFSRLGPSVREVKRCDALEGELLARGPAGVRAALAKLDDPRARNAMLRLYDVVARSADL